MDNLSEPSSPTVSTASADSRFTSLLENVRSKPPYCNWKEVSAGSGNGGGGLFRDYETNSNPSIQLSHFGLYDFKAGKITKSLIEVAQELGINVPKKPGKKRRLGSAAAGVAVNGSGMVELDKERAAAWQRILARLGSTEEEKKLWVRESWPIIKKYFRGRGITLPAKFFWKELRATVQQFVHPTTSEAVTEILIPMFGKEGEASGDLVQILKIQINPETGEKIGKKLKFTADRDRAILFGGDENGDANQVVIFEGIENALSTYQAAREVHGSDSEAVKGWVWCVSGPVTVIKKIGAVIEGYSRQVMIVDPDESRVGLRASVVLGEGVERMFVDAAAHPELLGRDVNDVLRQGGENGAQDVIAWLGGLRLVPWAEVLELGHAEEEKEEDQAEADSYEYHRAWNPFSDQGAAKYFAKRFGRRVKITEDGRWWVWSGKVWTCEHSEGIMRQWIASLLPTYLKMAKDQRLSEGEREGAGKFARTLGNAARQSSIMKCLPGMEELRGKVENFDRNPGIINLQNGVLELDTGVLHPHSPDWLCSKLARAAWTPGASCPVWDRFLDEIMCASSEAKADLWCYKYRQLGYLLSGYVTEKAFFFYLGVGDNGKSREVETIQFLLGSYAQKISTEILLENSSGSFSSETLYEVAGLPGIRMAVADEPDETRSWSETLLKKITSGGDTLTGRPIRKDPFEFRPTFKLVIHGNSRPKLRVGDSAIWNRLHQIPYDFVAVKQDKHLQEKLQQEIDGILQRLFFGYREWRAIGLDPPSRVIQSVTEYKQDISEMVLKYIENRCRKVEGAEIKATDLYCDYLEFCKERSIRPDTQTSFGRKLSLLGYEPMRRGGVVLRMGLLLLKTGDLFE